jgi:hypothetical protein
MPSNLFGAGSRIERSAQDVRDGQSRARMEDANTSTQNNTVTVQELRDRRK